MRNSAVKYLLGLALMLLASFNLSAKRQMLTDSLWHELSQTHNISDSLRLMLDIYDLVEYKDRGEMLDLIYNVAKRNGVDSTACDAVDLMAAYYELNDSVQPVLLERLRSLRPSERRRLSELYVKVRFSAQSARAIPEKLYSLRLKELLSKYKDIRQFDDYSHIEYLFNICSLIRSSSNSELLITYLNQLNDYIEKLPYNAFIIRIFFYNQAAISYLSIDKFSESVEATRKQLQAIKNLDRYHELSRRAFRYYNGAYYMCYHNLLICRDELSEAEIDSCYAKILDLDEKHSIVRNTDDVRNRSNIYYLMAKKRYSEAIPLIRHQLKQNNTRYETRRLTIDLIEAAEAVGDKAVLLDALEKYNDILTNFIQARTLENIRELQIIYDVNELKQDNDNIERENMEIESNQKSSRNTFATLALILVSLLLFETISLYRKSRHLTTNLLKMKEILVHDRDTMINTQHELEEAVNKAQADEHYKNDFVNNMNQEIRNPLSAIVEYSHLISDFADEDPRPYIREYGNALALNVDLLTTLVNDVLDLPNLENDKLNIRITRSSLHQICLLALDLVKKHVAPDVKLIFENADDEDIQLSLDPNRVEQVLISLLFNAAKFTENGTIALAYSLNPKENALTFSVTDTGIGIPRGKEEYIFGRFQKISSTTQGNGLGLYIARRIASLLNGSLKLDAEYRKGAKFIFTIPIS